VPAGVRLRRLFRGPAGLWRAMARRQKLPAFASSGKGLIIQPPYQVRNPDRIHLGRDVKIGPNSVLKAQEAYPGGWSRHPRGEHREQNFEPTLWIGDRVTATAMLQVTVFDRVTIEDDVMFAANVFIADGTHCADRGDVPYKFQGIGPVAPVHIGYGAWIGQNVVIMPGVTIGALSIVGANSVVNRDVDPGCVVAGTPARVIRLWDEQRECWRNPSQSGAIVD